MYCRDGNPALSANLPPVDPQEGDPDAVTSAPADPQSQTPPTPPTPVSSRFGSRYVPAVLDALIPGLGHLAAGRRRRAIVFLTPVVIALGPVSRPISARSRSARRSRSSSVRRFSLQAQR